MVKSKVSMHLLPMWDYMCSGSLGNVCVMQQSAIGDVWNNKKLWSAFARTIPWSGYCTRFLYILCNVYNDR